MATVYTKDTLKKMPVDFRIEAIAVDGMWLDKQKWIDQSMVTVEELDSWIEIALQEDRIIQSRYGGGVSYRMPLRAIVQWHKDYNYQLGDRITSFAYPPRIWGGKTEAEGFEDCPRREIGTATFTCPDYIAQEIIENLRGIARVRETRTGHYRAQGGSGHFISRIIKDVFKKYPNDKDVCTVNARSYAMRRELVDFPDAFIQGLIDFYYEYCKISLLKYSETMNIFLEEESDKDAQIIDWLVSAIEKYDERKAVPFSGYLFNVLGCWVFDLPDMFLGKKLATFQRERTRAIKQLRKDKGDYSAIFTHDEIADHMGLDIDTFEELESDYLSWFNFRTATDIHFSTDNNHTEEKISNNVVLAKDVSDESLEQSVKLTRALVDTALDSGDVTSLTIVVDSMGSHDDTTIALNNISEKFKDSLLKNMSKPQGEFIKW